MKRFFFTAVSAGFLIITLSLISLFYWIKKDVHNNIQMAEINYNSSGEEALISYLEDEKNSYYNRTHIAIWTLGKVRSQKAIPLLKKYYLNDPEGRSCKGMHEEMLCQYEIYKAINAIEDGALFSYASLR